MRSKILLINANRCATPDPVFPLGLSFLSSALRQAGYECEWLDSLAAGEPVEQILRRIQPAFAAISVRNIDDVLIRKRETFYHDLPSLVAAVRQHCHCPVILGGSAFSLFPERLLGLAEADFGIVGEGESSLLALLGALEKRTDYQNIPGLVFRRAGEVVLNQAQPEPVAWPLGESDRPAELGAFYSGRGSMLNVQTQRGCGHTCCYCTYPLIEGHQHRARPADMVADEFEQLQRQGARYVFVVDSVFNSTPRHVFEVCEALLRRRVTVPWGCFLRPQGLTAELANLMARAGLKHIEFGSDSFCDEVLWAYRKALTFDDIANASELARKAQVDFCHFLIAGGPGETMETLERTFENSRRLPGAVIMAVVGMRIYPRTHLYERAVVEGLLAADADLLQPTYYLAPGLTAEVVFAKLQEFTRRSPNWIPGDPEPGYQRFVDRLRQRGVAGPLWSYFSTLQHLWPQGIPATGATSSP